MAGTVSSETGVERLSFCPVGPDPVLTLEDWNMETHNVVSPDEWTKARVAFLTKEKELTHRKDALAAERRELPWMRIEKEYVFDGPNGHVTLSDLFDGRSQLFIKHFMMAPGVTHQCVGCSLDVDHIGPLLPHLENNDVSYAAVARAPIAEIETVRQRMGWSFLWVSSYRSDFNYDFNVSFTAEQVASGKALYNFQPAQDWVVGLQDLSGHSVFFKNTSGDIFLTYSAFGRGGEQFLGIYGFLDVMPKGRNETGPYHSLGDWARPHNMYGRGGMVEGTGRYHAADCGCAAHP